MGGRDDPPDAPVRACTTRLLHGAFLEQARRDPARPAVVTDSVSLTYGELERRSAAVADWLRRNGAQPGALVAIAMSKGWEQIVAALAVLRSGAAYLPIDPGFPRQRREYLLAQGRVALVLTQADLDSAWVWPDTVQRLCVDAKMPPTDRQDARSWSGQDECDIAYVIYTSGSTGLPKGVAIDHGGAANTIADINVRFDVGAADRVLALSALTFDLSVYDIFGTLAAGGAVVVPSGLTPPEPGRWLSIAAKSSVTVWNSVPALMEMAVTHLEIRGGPKPDGLRLVLLSGDWIPVSLPERIKALFPAATVVSLGGATETSIWSIVHVIDRVEPGWTSIPYGAALANQRFDVLDAGMKACEEGELYIGGRGVGLCYWRDPARTAASFLPHPETGERTYRTGDYGRWRPDGEIEFLGRRDGQVKLRGYRIELGEIEAAFLSHPFVRHAVALLDRHPTGARIVAYVALHPGSQITDGALREHAARALTGYMMPSVIRIVAAMPLTQNAKIDRAALALLQDRSASEVEAILDDLDAIDERTIEVGRERSV
jgi:amino acid adenylation domain-containing protein